MASKLAIFIPVHVLIDACSVINNQNLVHLQEVNYWLNIVRKVALLFLATRMLCFRNFCPVMATSNHVNYILLYL